MKYILSLITLVCLLGLNQSFAQSIKERQIAHKQQLVPHKAETISKTQEKPQGLQVTTQSSSEKLVKTKRILSSQQLSARSRTRHTAPLKEQNNIIIK